MTTTLYIRTANSRDNEAVFRQLSILRDYAEGHNLLVQGIYTDIYVRLRREGWQVNHKQVERIYYRGEDGRRPQPSHASRYPDPPGQDSVMRWTLSMTGS